MKGPLVSLVVPVFDGGRFLGEALESLLAQDYEPIQLIVVDDGSSDGSADIARSFPSVLLVQQENQGPAAARNAGLAVASGEFVAFHDADDLVPPMKLTLQVSYLLKHEAVGCVMGRQTWINPPSSLQRDQLFGELDGIPPTSAVFRKSIVQGLGGYDPSFRSHENMDLLFRLREAGIKIVVLPDVVLFRRYHGQNLSFTSWPDRDPRLRSLKAKLDRDRTARGGN